MGYGDGHEDVHADVGESGAAHLVWGAVRFERGSSAEDWLVVVLEPGGRGLVEHLMFAERARVKQCCWWVALVELDGGCGPCSL